MLLTAFLTSAEAQARAFLLDGFRDVIFTAEAVSAFALGREAVARVLLFLGWRFHRVLLLACRVMNLDGIA